MYSLEIIFVICNQTTDEIIGSFITQLVFLSLKIAVGLVKCIFREEVSPSIPGCGVGHLLGISKMKDNQVLVSCFRSFLLNGLICTGLTCTVC